MLLGCSLPQSYAYVLLNNSFPYFLRPLHYLPYKTANRRMLVQQSLFNKPMKIVALKFVLSLAKFAKRILRMLKQEDGFINLAPPNSGD